MVIKGQSDIEIQISDIGYICLKQNDGDGEHTISFAPRFTARLIAAPNTGCDSVVLAPSRKMTSVSCSISRIEPDAALVFIARCIALTDDEWQRRVQ